MEKFVVLLGLIVAVLFCLELGITLPTPVEVKADETSDERFEIMDSQRVGFLQVRIVCDKETQLVYTWAYAVDNGGRVGGVSIEPVNAQDGTIQLRNPNCGK